MCGKIAVKNLDRTYRKTIARRMHALTFQARTSLNALNPLQGIAVVGGRGCLQCNMLSILASLAVH